MLRLTAAVFWLNGAVCSQNPAHSFWLAGRPLPLCARDLGLFGGFLLAFVVLSLRRHRTWFWAWLLGLVPVALDGLASFAGLESSSNAVRLATGLLAGVSLAALVVPLLQAGACTGVDREQRRGGTTAARYPALLGQLMAGAGHLQSKISVQVLPLREDGSDLSRARGPLRRGAAGSVAVWTALTALAALAVSGHSYLVVSALATLGVVVVAAAANRLARLPWAAAAALALPELAALGLAKHLALAALG